MEEPGEIEGIGNNNNISQHMESQENGGKARKMTNGDTCATKWRENHVRITSVHLGWRKNKEDVGS